MTPLAGRRRTRTKVAKVGTFSRFEKTSAQHFDMMFGFRQSSEEEGKKKLQAQELSWWFLNRNFILYSHLSSTTTSAISYMNQCKLFFFFFKEQKTPLTSSCVLPSKTQFLKIKSVDFLTHLIWNITALDSLIFLLLLLLTNKTFCTTLYKSRVAPTHTQHNSF